jgi:hypothetical protein
MWRFPWSPNDSHKSTGYLEFSVSMVSINPKIKCFYSTESIRYGNQTNVFN